MWNTTKGRLFSLHFPLTSIAQLSLKCMSSVCKNPHGVTHMFLYKFYTDIEAKTYSFFKASKTDKTVINAFANVSFSTKLCRSICLHHCRTVQQRRTEDKPNTVLPSLLPYMPLCFVKTDTHCIYSYMLLQAPLFFFFFWNQVYSADAAVLFIIFFWFSILCGNDI